MSPKKSLVGFVLVDLDKVFDSSHRKLRKDPRYPELSKKALDYLMKEIRAYGDAARFLKNLCTAGCGEQELLRLLAACSENPDPERVAWMLGLDDRRLRAAVKSFSKCAGRIDQINQRPARLLFKESAINFPFRIPELLRNYGALLIFVADLRWRIYWRAAKRRLISYVQARTGQFHDKWVAELIAVAAQLENYDDRAHREWRHRNVEPVVPLKLPLATGLDGLAKRLLETVFFMCEYVLLVQLIKRTEIKSST